MRLPAIALFKFFNASYKLTESGTIATEMRSVLTRNHLMDGTLASETGGTMATETTLSSLARYHRNGWHNGDRVIQSADTSDSGTHKGSLIFENGFAAINLGINITIYQ